MQAHNLIAKENRGFNNLLNTMSGFSKTLILEKNLALIYCERIVKCWRYLFKQMPKEMYYWTQLTFTCSESTIETLEHSITYLKNQK